MNDAPTRGSGGTKSLRASASVGRATAGRAMGAACCASVTPLTNELIYLWVLILVYASAAIFHRRIRTNYMLSGVQPQKTEAGCRAAKEHYMRSPDGKFWVVGMAAAVVGIFFAFSVTSPVLAQNASGASSADCRSEQGLTYLCGFMAPEDIVNVGSRGLVLASGHRAPGHLYLIDPARGTRSELMQVQSFRLQHDTNAYPDCPGPLNREAVDVHGLSVGEASAGLFSIYTTSHGDREEIEIYDLDLRGKAPVLTWKGCVLLQKDGYFNGVAKLADGGFVATRMRDENARMDEIKPGAITGRVFQWHPGGQLQPLDGTELSLPNGIDISADERYLFVTATFTQELVRFDRHVTPMSKRAVSLPMLPDNVHWDGDGKLLIAGPNVVDPAVCKGGRCASGWTVVEVDPETLAVTRLGGANANAALQRASAAMRLGNEIWVGGTQDRIARFTLN